MSNENFMRWGKFATLIAVLAAGLYYFFGTHPPAGPARPIPTAERAKLLDGLVKRPSYAQFPQLKAKVVVDSVPAVAGTDEPLLDQGAAVSGRVLDKQSGAGISGASVSLVVAKLKGPALEGDVQREFAVLTDAEGRYEIADIRAFGDVHLFASAQGYSSERADLDVLRPGEVLDRVDLKLKPASGRIAGRVLDQARNPLPGVLVAVVSGPDGAGHMTLTDTKGTFSIALSSAGELTLGISKEGYGSECFADIEPGMETLEFILTQAGAIAGRVTDKQGRPKEGLNIVVGVEPSEQPGEKGEYLWSSSFKTDADGQYRADDLSASYRYIVRVTRAVGEDPPSASEKLEGLAAHLRTQKISEMSYDKFMHSQVPGSGLAAEGAVAVNPGQVTTVNLQIDANDVKTSVIYGQVTDPITGGPVCPISIQAFWDESVKPSTFLGFTTTGLDGFYQLNLSTVSQRERVWLTVGWDRSRAAGSLEADPEVPKELNFSLSAPITVHVRCVNEAGKPMAGIFVTPMDDTLTDAEGRATVYGLAPNISHTLSAYKPFQPAPGIRPQSGGRIGISEPFSGQPGEEVNDVLIQCSEAFGTVTGQLVVPPEAEEQMYSYTDVIGTCTYYESGEPVTLMAHLDRKTNRFSLDKAASGRGSIELWIAAPKAKVRWWALIENVDIVPGQITDLGVVQLNVSDIAQ